ncbi:MAG: stage V sporulation protein AE [Firmicutes bacterium]|nr:stage V sporulation protein AE [Bacillota bacterium]
MDFVKAFVVGGLICVVGQILIDKTMLTPARILVSFVVAGVALQLVGLYEPLVKFAGAGATIPLTGFGYNICKGMQTAVNENGFMGIFTGAFTSAAAGLGAAVFFGFLAAVIFKPKPKS